MTESSTSTVEDKIRSMFAMVKPKHKPQVLEALKARADHLDKVSYLRGWLSYDVPVRR